MVTGVENVHSKALHAKKNMLNVLQQMCTKYSCERFIKEMNYTSSSNIVLWCGQRKFYASYYSLTAANTL